MKELDAILKRLQENEEIARKFNSVETKILSILNFRDLFEVLLTEIRDTFKVPYVWISMVKDSEVSSLIESLGTSDLLKEHMNLIEKHVFLDLIDHQSKPILVNEDLKPFFKLLPQNRKYFFKSLAVAPITLDGTIIGSLNQADASDQRFKPGIDPSLLEQLALKVSLCLSNVTAHEKLKFMAYHDPLTGLLNRRVMEKILKREFLRAKRYSSPLSLAFIDLDHFKQVNDNYGHDQGDSLLIFVADIFMKMSRQSDVVGRFAGDEFILLLPETDAASAETLIQRMLEHLSRRPFAARGNNFHVSFSYGIVSTEDPSIEEPSQLLKNADTELYKAKKERGVSRSALSVSPQENGNVIDLVTAMLGKEGDDV